MPENKEQSGPGASGAVRRRARFAAEKNGGRLSRPLLVALLVILAGAAYLFWPRGGSAPTGIGEQLTVVTADSSLASAPRSGSVDIQTEQRALVPARPAGAASRPAAEPVATGRAGGATEAGPRDAIGASRAVTPVEPVGEAPSETTTPSAPRPSGLRPVVPQPNGSWAVQLAAFASEANADKLVSDLASKGVSAQVRAASTSSGDMIYRVWIGWFASRQLALDYAAQEKARIGDAYPVHR